MNPTMGYLTFEKIDVGKVIFDSGDSSIGGTVVFLGTVRGHDKENVKVCGLYYEAYEKMAEEEFLAIETEARQKWNIEKISAIHRLGRLNVGEVSVAVVVSSKHRKEAFDACRFIIDSIKTRVPIWKMEVTDTGSKWLAGTLLVSRKK
jgi:molybdopterin synthase catalytic subunit